MGKRGRKGGGGRKEAHRLSAPLGNGGRTESGKQCLRNEEKSHKNTKKNESARQKPLALCSMEGRALTKGAPIDDVESPKNKRRKRQSGRKSLGSSHTVSAVDNSLTLSLFLSSFFSSPLYFFLLSLAENVNK